jgi:hypothetical protein
MRKYELISCEKCECSPRHQRKSISPSWSSRFADRSPTLTSSTFSGSLTLSGTDLSQCFAVQSMDPYGGAVGVNILGGFDHLSFVLTVTNTNIRDSTLVASYPTMTAGTAGVGGAVGVVVSAFAGGGGGSDLNITAQFVNSQFDNNRIGVMNPDPSNPFPIELPPRSGPFAPDRTGTVVAVI